MSRPRVAVIKRLFALSGNRCAFPGCTTELVHADSGKVTGCLCHINAREFGGPRYDPSQTDDERNGFENLLLMCPIHHAVIDSDTESYSVEWLHGIKATHEAGNVAGPEPSDQIALELLAGIHSHIAIVLNADADGRIQWSGDVLHGGTKTVVHQSSPSGTQEATRPVALKKLVGDIRSELYDDNRRLPYVLALCVDLCDMAGMSGEYGGWLDRELKGYKDYGAFRDEFKDAEEFEDWMDKWASHRLVRAYIKALMPSSRTVRPEIQELPIGRVLVAFPVAQIARDLEDAKASGAREFFVALLQLGREHFAKLESVVAEVSPGTSVTPDVRAYYRVAELEHVLDEVRNMVLTLLRDARSRLE